MVFLIKQNSTLPLLTMKVIEPYGIDLKEFKSMFNNATVTFSMIDAESGKYIIANKAGGILKTTSIINISCEDNEEILIYYEWLSKDTRKSGTFIGEFTINFFDENGDDKGILKVPIGEKLYIHIQESFGKTSINAF